MVLSGIQTMRGWRPLITPSYKGENPFIIPKKNKKPKKTKTTEEERTFLNGACPLIIPKR